MIRERIKTILVQARALIETPERWTQGRSRGIHYTDDTLDCPVHCYCAIGAIWTTAGSIHSQDAKYAEAVLADALTSPGMGNCPLAQIVNFNDAKERTHDEVLALFDRAIERAS